MRLWLASLRRFNSEGCPLGIVVWCVVVVWLPSVVLVALLLPVVVGLLFMLLLQLLLWLQRTPAVPIRSECFY